MHRTRKLWLRLILGVILLATAVLLAEWFCRPPKGTLSPPPGPHQAGDVWMADLGGKTTMAMVWCPPGKFMMGSPVTKVVHEAWANDEPLHEVTLSQGFWLGKYEGTQAQWWAVMGTRPSCFPQKKTIHWRLWRWQIPIWQKNFGVSHRQLPVEKITWDECQEFCRKAGFGFRLPRETEWEYGCRAGSAGLFAGTGVLNDMGWFNGNTAIKTHPVGQKKPNAWGLYDMHGNVNEWCQDWYGNYSTETLIDPVGPASGKWRVFRGGCLGYLAVDCQSASRNSGEPDIRDEYIGFRVVFRTVP